MGELQDRINVLEERERNSKIEERRLVGRLARWGVGLAIFAALCAFSIKGTIKQRSRNIKELNYLREVTKKNEVLLNSYLKKFDKNNDGRIDFHETVGGRYLKGELPWEETVYFVTEDSNRAEPGVRAIGFGAWMSVIPKSHLENYVLGDN